MIREITQPQLKHVPQPRREASSGCDAGGIFYLRAIGRKPAAAFNDVNLDLPWLKDHLAVAIGPGGNIVHPRISLLCCKGFGRV